MKKYKPMFTISTHILDLDNHIRVLYDDISYPYTHIIEEHYSNERFRDTIFMLTPCYPCFSFSGNLISPEMMEGYNNRIFCNFDHFVYEDYKEMLFQWIRDSNITKVWEWQINMINIYPDDIRPMVEFMPVRYCQWYEQFRTDRSAEKIYDVAFIGNINHRRYNILCDYFSNYSNIKTVLGYGLSELAYEFDNCKCILNIHGDDGNNQEQLRIFEAICLNIPVVSEISPVNYFPGMVIEVPTAQISQLDIMSELTGGINQNFDRAGFYKLMTYTDEAFEEYRRLFT